jgi:hypothetical protein
MPEDETGRLVAEKESSCRFWLSIFSPCDGEENG